MKSWITCAGMVALSASACSPQSGEVATAAAGYTVTDVHTKLIDPGSEALFAAEADLPTTEEGWRAVEAAAQKMVDAAGLLQTAPRLKDHSDWLRISKAVEDAARQSALAARSRDSEALQIADGAFLAQCEDCHKIYRDVGGGMMANPDK